MINSLGYGDGNGDKFDAHRRIVDDDLMNLKITDR